jgi:zona occludens toxin
MISLVTGSPGAGKSYYAVRRIKASLESGRYVATNIELRDGWDVAIARSNLITRLVPGRTDKKAALYRRRMYVSPDLDELFRIRLKGDKEGRGVMVLDEAHNWMNGRTWDVDETSGRGRVDKGLAVRRRLDVVRFFSQHRKLGWDVDLVTQAEASLDAQVRRLFEKQVRLRNLGRFKVAGIRLFPFNLFVAIHVWNDASKSILKREAYALNKRTARLYDTMALSHGLEDEDDPVDLIWLPHPVQETAPSPQTPPRRRRPLFRRIATTASFVGAGDQPGGDDE